MTRRCWVIVGVLTACGSKSGPDREAQEKAAASEAEVTQTIEREPVAVVATLQRLGDRARAVANAIGNKDAVAALPACRKGKPPGARQPALVITDETLRFLASGTVHEKDKQGLFGHWDQARSVLGTVSAWSDYERQRRYQDHLGRDRTMSPTELQRARARLAEEPTPPLDGHVIVVEPRNLDQDEVSGNAVVVDPANELLCRIQVTARSRVEVVALGGDGGGARDAREYELVKELRWQLHLALSKTTQPIKFDYEVSDPTANLRKL